MTPTQTPTKNGTTAPAVVTRSPLYALSERFQVDPNKITKILRGTVIKPDRNGKEATDEEVAAFCIVARQYDLNPFTREIHAFASNGTIVPIVGIDGWVRIVNRDERFDGCEFEDVPDEKGLPVAITCRMHVKGRAHPVCVTERLMECRRNTPPWNTMPWRMLRHKAYMQAARLAFGLAGLYDEDEAADIRKNQVIEVQVDEPKRSMAERIRENTPKAQPVAQPEEEAPAEPEQPDPQPAPAPQPQSPPKQIDLDSEFKALCDRIETLCTIKGTTVRTTTKGKKLFQLSLEDAEAIVAKLEAMPDARQPGDEDE